MVGFEASGGRSRWLVIVFDGKLDLNCVTLKSESDVQEGVAFQSYAQGLERGPAGILDDVQESGQ